MARQLSVDTTFLIDLQRERLNAGGDGPAHEFLQQSPDTELFLSAVALGEFVEGFDRVDHPLVTVVRNAHTLIPVDDEVAMVYARVVRKLRGRGELIGTNDLWIAASSLRLNMPILTANVERFRRIDGLGIVRYR